MSGLDEQIKKVPACSKCKIIPSFYCINLCTFRDKIWLYSEKGARHRMQVSDIGKMTGENGIVGPVISSNVDYVYCSDCGHMNKETRMKENVIKLYKMLEGKRYDV